MIAFTFKRMSTSDVTMYHKITNQINKFMLSTLKKQALVLSRRAPKISLHF